MDDIRVTGDAAYREELTSYIDESQFKAAFEHRYDRGWQRKLGAVLDVPETTVNGWFKSGRFPPLAKVAFGVLLSRDIRPHRNWIPVRNGGGYAVCDTHGPVGRIVADNITRLEDAMLLAAAPQLYEASGDAFVVFDDARDFMGDWGDLAADKLREGLDAAKPDRWGGGDSDEEKQDTSDVPEGFTCPEDESAPQGDPASLRSPASPLPRRSPSARAPSGVEVIKFAQSVGAKPERQLGFRRRNYFKLNDTALIVKISRSDRPFWGVGKKALERLGDSNYLLVLLSSSREGWVFSKTEVKENIAMGKWRLAQNDYKINMPLPDQNSFSSPEHFLQQVDG